MTRAAQLRREREFVDALLAIREVELRGEPKAMKPPLPDFELTLANGRRVGLEVTEAVDPEVAAAWHGAGAQLREEVTRRLKERSITAFVTVAIDIDSLSALQRSPRYLNDTADKVAERARASLPEGLPATRRVGDIDALRFLEVQ